MTEAWHFGRMHHTDPKKYPRKPEDLWHEEQQSETALIGEMLALKNAGERRERMKARQEKKKK